MRVKHLLALGGLIGGIGIVLAVSSPVHSQRPEPPPAKETLPQRLARRTQVKEDSVAAILDRLGPEVQEELRQGKSVSFPGLGTFRVVQVPEHRDLKEGRPVVVAAFNTVEFIPDGDMSAAANGPGAKPADTVPRYEFNTFPNQGRDPGIKVPSVKTQPKHD